MNIALKLAAAACALAAAAANAATVTVNVPDVGSYEYFGTGPGLSVTYGGVTFTQLSDGNFFSVSPGYSSAPLPVVSSQQGSSGNVLQITLPTSAYAITINYGIYNVGAVVDFTIGANTDSVPTIASGDFYSTFTVYNSGTVSPFTTLTASTAARGLNISSITYSTAVPEPASWALMIVGFGTAGAVLRRRRQLVAA